MMNAYRIKEIDIGCWYIFLYDTPIGHDSFSKELAETICQALNEASRSGYNRGYDAGQSASERLRTLQ